MNTPNRSPEEKLAWECCPMDCSIDDDCHKEFKDAILSERKKVEELEKKYQWATVGVGLKKGQLIDKLAAQSSLLSELGEALDLIFKGADEVERMNTTNALRDLMNIILSKKLLLAKYTTFKSLTEQSEKEK